MNWHQRYPELDLREGEELLFWVQGMEFFNDLEEFLDTMEDRVREGEELPKSVTLGRFWRPEEIASRFGKWYAARLPDDIWEDCEVSSEDNVRDDFPSLTSEEREGLIAALLPWARRCHPRMVVTLGLIDVDLAWWAEHGLEMQEKP